MINDFPFKVTHSVPLKFNETDFDCFQVLQYIQYIIKLNKGEDFEIVNNTLSFKSHWMLMFSSWNIIGSVDSGKFEITGEKNERRLTYSFFLFNIYWFDILVAAILDNIFHSWELAFLGYFVIIILNFFIVVWRQYILLSKLSKSISKEFN